MNFKDVNFMYYDAEEEKAYNPNGIVNNYFEFCGEISEIQQAQKFLVFGLKGSGKSMLGAFLERSKVANKNEWVFAENLEQYQFNLLEKCGGNSSVGGNISAWEMIIKIRIMGMMAEREDLLAASPGLGSACGLLKKYGFLESSSLLKITQCSARRGAFGEIKLAFASANINVGNDESVSIKDAAAASAAIDKIIDMVGLNNNHNFLLVIDGLDYIMKNGKENGNYLSDLISAVKNINKNHSKNKIKVILTLRSDLIPHIPNANLGKTLNDNGIELNWYDNPRDVNKNALVKMLEKRFLNAGYTGNIFEIFSRMFPDSIDGRPYLKFLLDNTRYLPRDVIALFHNLQKLRAEPPFSRENILTACGNYSDWFYIELCDALVGLVDEPIRSRVQEILQGLGREFALSDFTERLKRLGISCNEHELCSALFNASIIGNVWETQEGGRRYSFAYRKNNLRFDDGKRIIVHTGLWKTLNLI